MASSSGRSQFFGESNPNIVDVQEQQQYVPTQESERNVEHDREEKNFTSDIFQVHFKRTQKTDGTYDVICNYCGQIYKYKAGGGYGTFQRHLERKHPGQIGVQKKQTQISGFATPSQLFRYTDENNKLELARMISIESLSFSFGERVGFINYAQKALNPQAKRVPRNTLKRAVLKLYKQEKKELRQLFNNLNGHVSICCDIWSDHWQKHSYMGITCHWVDNDWLLQKRIIAFRVFDERHTADNIYRIIINILEEYSLVNKIFSISFDNASANTASITELKNICQPNIGGKFFHIRCACHVLNLCVQDGLKILDVVLSPIKKAITYLWTHPQMGKLWYKFCKDNGKRPKRFPKDIPTRWNSTYQLLNESFEYKDLLCTFISNNVQQVCLYPQNWDVCANLLNVLKVFYDATNILSGVYYPTSHLLLIECINIAWILQEHENDLVLKESIESMRAKWLNYYNEIPLVNLVACVFDPRCKIDGLYEYLNTYYSFVFGEQHNISIDLKISTVRKAIGDIYIEFSMIYQALSSSSNVSTPSTTSQDQSEQITRISMGDRLLMQRHKKPRGLSGSTSEFDIYLTTVFEFGDSNTGKDFPVLEWWKRHQNTFPILTQIARHIFACPVSTVAVEQAFSAGGRTLDESRSYLHPESLEAQVCVEDWSKAAIREQENKQLEDDDLYDFTTETDATTGTSTSGVGSD